MTAESSKRFVDDLLADASPFVCILMSFYDLCKAVLCFLRRDNQVPEAAHQEPPIVLILLRVRNWILMCPCPFLEEFLMPVSCTPDPACPDLGCVLSWAVSATLPSSLGTCATNPGVLTCALRVVYWPRSGGSLSLSSSDGVITKSQPRRKIALRNHCHKTGEYMMSRIDSNKGMLSVTCIKGVELVGMPEKP